MFENGTWQPLCELSIWKITKLFWMGKSGNPVHHPALVMRFKNLKTTSQLWLGWSQKTSQIFTPSTSLQSCIMESIGPFHWGVFEGIEKYIPHTNSVVLGSQKCFLQNVEEHIPACTVAPGISKHTSGSRDSHIAHSNALVQWKTENSGKV